MVKTAVFVTALIFSFIFETPCIIQLVTGTVYKVDCPYWPRLPILNQVQGSLGTVLFFCLLLAVLSFKCDSEALGTGLIVLVVLIYGTQGVISLYATIAYFVENKKDIMQGNNATLSTYCHPKLLDYSKATSITEIVLEVLSGCVARAIRE
jgi:hypothetical protein